MPTNEAREAGLERLTYDKLSISNQHYIVSYFIKQDIADAANLYARGRLLDIGCGNKPYQSLFEEKVSQYIGCDIVQSSEKLVDQVCPANELSFDNDSFDTVFSTQVMEHVADFEGMVRESYRVLKNGGYALFTVPFAWELHEEPYDFFRFSKHGLKQLFEKHGYEVVKIKSNGGKWAAITQLWLNVLLSTRRFHTFRSKIIKLLFIRLRFIYLYNRFSIWLDKTYFDDILTLNYIAIVKKKNS
jgi:SAM-dependent methyltransferase